MPVDLVDHLVVLGVAFATVVIATPVVRWAARAVGAVSVPGDRHVHTRPTPTMGGLAILAGLLAALLVASRLSTFDAIFRTTSEPEAILLAAMFMVVVGVADDLRGLSAPAKLAGQMVAAGVLALFGVTLRFVYIPGNPGSIVNLSPDLAALVTIVAVVAMVNAVNLVDGLDGLAAGIVTIAAIALFTYTRLAEPGSVPLDFEISSAGLLLAALAGACLGFLVHNFHPASIFMGDTGSLLIGFLLAAAGISAIGNTIQPTRTDFFVASVPALIPALVLAVPFVDTVLAVTRRLGSGRAISSPDAGHLHHRLVQIGHSHRRAVLIMYYWSALLAFAVVGWALLPAAVVTTVVSGGLLLALVVTLAAHLRRAALRRRLDPDGGIVYSFTSARRQRHSSRVDK